MAFYSILKVKEILFFCIGSATILFFGTTPAIAELATSVSQHGVTWYFDKAYEVGKFANGDYWVKGPITINSITPAYDGSANGWEVNPKVGRYHGFDDGCKNGGFKPDLVPSLPYTSKSPIESIVKTIRSGQKQPCIQTAAVLTVVSSVPANNGSTVFRPPYVGTDKPFYSVNDLRTDLLPSYAPVGSPPSLSTVEGYFEYLRLEHLTSNSLRDVRPDDAMENYNPKNQPSNHETLLRLMLNDSFTDKKPALINYVQHGIDKAHAVIDGWVIHSADGHDPGHRIIAAFAATMLDITEAKAALNNASGFHEDVHIKDGISTLLWGENTIERWYWEYIRGLGGSRSRKDPYGFIDGGKCGADYQIIVTQSYKASVLATILMPSLQNAWNTAPWEKVRKYVDRWVTVGIWSQPDPCAPVSGTYGVDYGPDPSNPGMCILDADLAYYNSPTDFACSVGNECGRYPAKHGTSTDGGMYKSAFVAAMWDAYRASSLAPITAPVNLLILE